MMLIPLLILAAAIFGFPAYLAYLRAQGDPVKRDFADELELALQNGMARITDLARDAWNGTRGAWNSVMPGIFRQFGWMVVVVIAVAGFIGCFYGCWTGHWGKSLVFILVPTIVSGWWMRRVTLSMKLTTAPLPPPPPAGGGPAPPPPSPRWFNPASMLNSTLILFAGLGSLWVVIGLWIHRSHTVGWESNGRPITWIGTALIIMSIALLRAVIKIVMILAAKGVAFAEAVPNKLIQAIVALISSNYTALGAVAAPSHPGPVDIAEQEKFMERGDALVDGICLVAYTILAFTLLVMSFGGMFVIMLVDAISFMVLELIRIRASGIDDKKTRDDALAAVQQRKLRSAKLFAMLNYVLLPLIVLPVFFPGLEHALDNLGVTLNFFMLSVAAGIGHTLNWMVEFVKNDRTISIRNDTWKGALWGFLGFGAFFVLIFPWKTKANPATTSATTSYLMGFRKVLAVPTGLLSLVFAFSFIVTMVAKSSHSYADAISIKGLAVEKMPFLNVRKIESAPGWDFSWAGVPNAIGYKLERRHDSDKDFQPVRGADWLKEDVHHWADTDIKPGEKWYYQLRAIYNGRLSEPTDEYWMIWPDPNWKPSASTPDGGVPAAPSSPVAPPVPAAGAPDGGVSTQTGEDPEAFGKFLDTL
ncbi:MAG: hypothetical protein Q8R07_03125 [Candidatus Uhrbacteria bacterium]|nr:hypothetical protein [Candidatus Uhrbacteria bacterium]